MVLQFKRSILTSVLTVLVAAGCSDDPTGLGEPGKFDAIGAGANLNVVSDAFNSQAFQSFSALGAKFNVPVAGASAALLVETVGRRDLTRSSRVRLAAERLVDIAPSLASATAADLIPAELRGLVLTYNVEEERYTVDPTRAGPETGIEFRLYAVNPVSGDIVVPLVDVGYAQILDVGTETSAGLRILVVSGEEPFLDYTVSTTGVITSPTITISGFVSDGEQQVDFDLSNSATVTLGGSSINLDWSIDVEGADFHVDVTVDVTASEATGVSTVIRIEVRHGVDTIVVEGTTTGEEIGTLTVTANGQLFATITVTQEGITAVGADEQPLSAEAQQVLQDIFELVEEVFDWFEGLFHPVEFIFGDE